MIDSLEVPTTSDWQPLTDKPALAALGKLGEEANELGKIICRIIVQGGLDQVDPESLKQNWRSLSEEIADVKAMCQVVIEHFELDETFIHNRMRVKHKAKMQWIKQLVEQRDNPTQDTQIVLTKDDVKNMVDKFLSWPIPKDFDPDGGIEYKPLHDDYTPTGTNLLNATQAEAMIKHILGLPKNLYGL
jgi:CHAD domain-containing protein